MPLEVLFARVTKVADQAQRAACTQFLEEAHTGHRRPGDQQRGVTQALEVAQQNLPGTTGQYPNWRRKMTFTVEQLSTEKTALDFTAMFRNWLIRTGRTGAGSANA